MCSTFKLPLVAAILQKVDRQELSLRQAIAYTKADLASYSPVTEKNVEEGSMTLEALAEAAQTLSDNTAANLLLQRLGGPPGLTRFFRSLGDETSRLDRFEPELNHTAPGGLDTTTPEAMARTAATLLAKDTLSDPSRGLLTDWLRQTKTGRARIRASLPSDWLAGDKTGTAAGIGEPSKYNDVAIAWPPGRGLVVITTYFETAAPTEDTRDEDQAVLAEAGRIAARWLG